MTSTVHDSVRQSAGLPDGNLLAPRPGVPDYCIQAVNEFISRGGTFKGLRVLAVGENLLPREAVLDELGVKQWVCIDAALADSSTASLAQHLPFPQDDYVLLRGAPEHLPPSFDGCFDLVFSIYRFERMASLGAALARMHAALRPGGTLFSYFGPIWSAPTGSRFWIRPDFNFGVAGPMPEWGHLAMDRAELQQHLIDAGVEASVVDYLLHQVYESATINRLFFEDYVAAMESSDFDRFTLDPLWRRPVPEELQRHLESRHPGHREFSACGIRILARRAGPISKVHKERSVLICGAGRSGTSALAGLFDSQTYHKGDDLYPATILNPKGYFENLAINDLNELILVRSAMAHFGAEGAEALLAPFTRGQLWLGRWPASMPAEADEALGRSIRALLGQKPFCLKDPRFSVTAPAWLKQAPEAVVLCIFRPPAVTAESILQACRTAPYLRGLRISVEDAFAVWRQQYRRVLQLYLERDDVLFLRYADLFDRERLASLEDYLGTKLVHDFADPALDRTETRLEPDARSQAQYELLDAVSGADFGADRNKAMAWVKAALDGPESHAAPLPARWQFKR
jgi:hypothetical protein